MFLPVYYSCIIPEYGHAFATVIWINRVAPLRYMSSIFNSYNTLNHNEGRSDSDLKPCPVMKFLP